MRKIRISACILAALGAMISSFCVTAAQPERPSNAEVLFKLNNPCPATGEATGPCTGYVVDRIIPIVCGGTDDPENMQWQTLAQAKEKDRWERIGCRKGRRLVLPSESSNVTEAFGTGELPGGVEVQALPGRSATPR